MRLYLAALAYALYTRGNFYSLPNWLFWFLYHNHLTPLRLFYWLTGAKITSGDLWNKTAPMARRDKVRRLAKLKGWSL